MKKQSKLLFFFLLATVSPAAAQSPSSSLFELPEITVTATRTPVKTAIVSAPVSIITAKDIKALHAHTLKDALESAPGISILRSGGRESLFIRGFDSRYCMILIDGKRLLSEPDPLYELNRISLENVERIEIVRGPASALYGSEALGGIVNVITKSSDHPVCTLSWEPVWSGHRHLSNRYSFSFDSGRKQTFRVLFSVSSDRPGALTKNNGTTYTPFGTRNYFSTRLDYNPTDTKSFTFHFSRLQENLYEYVRQGAFPIEIKNDNQRDEYSLSYTRQLTGGQMFLRLTHSLWDKYNDARNRNSGTYTNATYGFRSLTTLEAQLRKTLSSRHQLTLGGEFRPEVFRGTGIQSGAGQFSKTFHGKTYLGSEVQTDFSAFYVQDECSLSPRTTLTTALRLDTSSRFDSHISPKVSLTYAPSPNWRLKFNAGQGFRSPSPNQLYLSLRVPRMGKLVELAGNPHLQPETSTTFDLSLERDFGRSTGKLTWFTSSIKNMIDQVWVSPSRLEFQNIHQAQLQGIEAEWKMPLTKKLIWTANYTYLDAVNQSTSTPLYERPRHKISSRFSYKPTPLWNLNLWNDTYLQEILQTGPSETTKKSYTLWNLNLERQLSSQHSIAFKIENLANCTDNDLSLPGRIYRLNYQVRW